jgi:hypothetical protein
MKDSPFERETLRLVTACVTNTASPAPKLRRAAR